MLHIDTNKERIDKYNREHYTPVNSRTLSEIYTLTKDPMDFYKEEILPNINLLNTDDFKNFLSRYASCTIDFTSRQYIIYNTINSQNSSGETQDGICRKGCTAQLDVVDNVPFDDINPIVSVLIMIYYCNVVLNIRPEICEKSLYNCIVCDVIASLTRSDFKICMHADTLYKMICGIDIEPLVKQDFNWMGYVVSFSEFVVYYHEIPAIEKLKYNDNDIAQSVLKYISNLTLNDLNDNLNDNLNEGVSHNSNMENLMKKQIKLDVEALYDWSNLAEVKNVEFYRMTYIHLYNLTMLLHMDFNDLRDLIHDSLMSDFGLEDNN